MDPPAAPAPGGLDVSREPERSPREAERAELIREGTTMALYVGLSLLAVMLILPEDQAAGRWSRAGTLALASLGLLLAHITASQISARLVDGRRFKGDRAVVLGAQVLAGLGITLVAAIPVVILSGPDGVLASELLLLGLIASVAYTAARRSPASRVRSVAYSVLIVLVCIGVLWVKSLAAH